MSDTARSGLRDLVQQLQVVRWIALACRKYRRIHSAERPALTLVPMPRAASSSCASQLICCRRGCCGSADSSALRREIRPLRTLRLPSLVRTDGLGPLLRGVERSDQLPASARCGSRADRRARPSRWARDERSCCRSGVARARHLGQAVRTNASAFARDQLRQAFGRAGARTAVIADKKAAVQQRNRELDIVLVEAGAVVKSASGGADAQAAVPQLLADLAHRLFGPAAQRVRFRKKQKVDIGVGKQRGGRIRPGRPVRIPARGRDVPGSRDGPAAAYRPTRVRSAVAAWPEPFASKSRRKRSNSCR